MFSQKHLCRLLLVFVLLVLVIMLVAVVNVAAANAVFITVALAGLLSTHKQATVLRDFTSLSSSIVVLLHVMSCHVMSLNAGRWCKTSNAPVI